MVGGHTKTESEWIRQWRSMVWGGGGGGGVKERECKAFFCEKRHERQAINSTVDGIFRAAKQSAGDQTDDERDSFTSAIRFRSLNEI